MKMRSDLLKRRSLINPGWNDTPAHDKLGPFSDDDCKGWDYSFGACVCVHMRVRVCVLLYTVARPKTPGSQDLSERRETLRGSKTDRQTKNKRKIDIDRDRNRHRERDRNQERQR